MFENIGLSVLSWKAPKTLKATLDNYAENDIFTLFKETWVTLAEASKADIETVESYAVNYKCYEKNLGIQGGMKAAAANFSTEFILFLENDNPLVESRQEVERQITVALEAFQEGAIDVMRLRHRFQPGEDYDITKYSRYHALKEPHPDFVRHSVLSKDSAFIKSLRRVIRPEKSERMIGNTVYVEKNPERFAPNHISAWKDIHIVDSCVLSWTNQAIIVRKSFFMELVAWADAHPSSRTVNGMQDLEKPLNCRWWREQHFKIGVGRGLFTHRRLDR